MTLFQFFAFAVSVARLANRHFVLLLCHLYFLLAILRQILLHRLMQFYTRYNNDRNQGSTLGIPTAKFCSLYELDKIKIIPLGKRRTKFKLKVAFQDVLILPEIDRCKYPLGSLTAGNMNQRDSRFIF